MARESTRARERAFFEEFQRHFPLPPGAIEYGDKPDIVIRGPQLIGIEVTNLYIADGRDPTATQRLRSRREEAIALAQRRYETKGGRPFEINVDFEPRALIRDVSVLADSIVAIALAVQHGPGGTLLREAHEAVPEIRWMHRSDAEWPDARWKNLQGFSVPMLDPARAQAVVDAKIEKLPGYRRCDVHWLLVVVDFWDPAQDLEMQWPPGSKLRRGAFERIFLYKPQFAICIEPPSTV